MGPLCLVINGELLLFFRPQPYAHWVSQEDELHSQAVARGFSPYMESWANWNSKKKIAFLTEWADKHSRLHKNRKGCRSQCLPAEGTENTHQGAILRKLSSTMSKGSERTRTCCRQNTNIYSCNEKKGLWKSDIKTYVRSPCSRFQTYLGPKDILGREGNKVWQPWHIYLII